MDIIISNNISVTDKDKQDIQEGVLWLDEWLQKRLSNSDVTQNFEYFSTNNDGLPNWHERYQTCSDKLNNLNIFVGKGAYDFEEYIKEGLISGKIHLTEKYLKRYNNDIEEAIKHLNFDTNGELYGVRYKFIKEPMIFITQKALNKNITSSIVAHECTHLLELFDQEAVAEETIHNDTYYSKDRYSMYLDSREEVYARTMQFRKAFNLDPNKKYTVDDIAKIRDEYEKNSDVIGIARKSLPKNKPFSYEALNKAIEKAEENINPEQQDLEKDFLNRYTNEQIMNLLNNTASVDINSLNSYDNLKNFMLHDFALNRKKIDVLCKQLKNNNKDHQTSNIKISKEIDRNIIFKMNDNQYS